MMPITRMLPRSGPCDLRLLIPDTGLGKEGFHDVVIENLLGTSVWRSKHVTPADVIGLRQRWPKAVFQVMIPHGNVVWSWKTYGGERIRVASRLIITLGGAIARCARPNLTMPWILT